MAIAQHYGERQLPVMFPAAADRMAVTLAENQSIPFALEFFNDNAFASVELHWIRPAIPGSGETTTVDEMVPQSWMAPADVAPSAVTLAGSDAAIDEGGSIGDVALSANDSGTGVDPVASWIVHTGEQDVEFAGNALTVSIPFDNQGVYTVTAEAIGFSGMHYPAGGSFVATVNNVLPGIAALTAATYRVGELAVICVPLNDPGTGSVHTAAIDWGDGTITTPEILEGNGAGSVYDTHAYAAAGSYTVTLTVHEGAGAVQQSAVMTITNAASVLSPFSVESIDEGGTAGFAVNFSDADIYETRAALIDWGDGSSEAGIVNDSNGTGNIVGSHVYVDNGTFAVTVTLSDGSGAAVTQSATVAVVNVAPRVDIGGFVQRYTVGDAISLSAEVFDPGVMDTDTYQWTIRDANNQILSTATTQSLTLDSTFTATYNVTLVVTDKDGGVGSAGARVVVDAVGATPDTGVPTAPTGLALGTVSPDGVSLSWVDQSSDEDGFVVEWSDDGLDYYVIDDLPAGSTGYLDDYPLKNAHNDYRVRAYREDVESDPTAVVDADVLTASDAFYDDNAGANARGTLSPYCVVHDHVLHDSVPGNDLTFTSEVTYQAAVDADAAHGDLDLHADGSFDYTPDAGYVGSDSFTYTVWNGHYTSKPATAAIDVTNASPIASNQQVLLDVVPDGSRFAASGAVSASDGDGDPFTYEVIERPQHGTFSFDEVTGQFEYAPRADYAGYDRFTYIAKDGFAEEPDEWDADLTQGQAAIVSFEDHAPLAGRHFPTEVLKNTFANRASPNSRTLTSEEVTIWSQKVSGPSHGSFTWQSGWGWTYTPEEDFTGVDTATFVLQLYGRESKPFTVSFNVVDQLSPGDPLMSSRPAQLVFGVDPDEPTSYTPVQSHITDYDRGKRVQLVDNTAHGKATLTEFGGFTYTPKAGDDYRGWDYFSFKYVGEPRNAGLNWMVIDVGGEVTNTTPPAPVFNPATFPATLQGVWRAYMTAKDLGAVVVGQMAQFGEAARQVADKPQDDNEQEQTDAIALLELVNQSFAKYSQQAQKAHEIAGEYMKKIWITTEARAAALNAVNKLPLSIAGLTATNDQLKKWSASLAKFAEGADFMVEQNNMVVKFAEDAHKVLETASMVGGYGALAATGARLLTKQGCAQFAKFTAQALVNQVRAAIISEATSQALKLAELLGIEISPDTAQYIKWGADAVQIVSLWSAARALRKAAASNCFVAGTEVLAGYSNQPGVSADKPIQELRIGDEVWSRDQYHPDAPLELKRVARTFKHTAYDLQSVSVTDETGNTEVFHVTDEHPFFVEGRGFTNAADLSIGEHLDSADGHTLMVTGNTDDKRPQGVPVYNFEVAGDHTYFVADGTRVHDFVWVHNVCDKEGNFLGPLKDAPDGKLLAFPGIKGKKVTVTIRSQSATDALQTAATTPKRNFLIAIANDPASVAKLQKAGIPPAEIARMRAGNSPAGYQVHHKQSLKLGGDNSQDSFILMPSFPSKPNYHSALTNDQNILSSGKDVGASFDADLPDFTGIIYAP